MEDLYWQLADDGSYCGLEMPLYYGWSDENLQEWLEVFKLYAYARHWDGLRMCEMLPVYLRDHALNLYRTLTQPERKDFTLLQIALQDALQPSDTADPVCETVLLNCTVCELVDQCESQAASEPEKCSVALGIAKDSKESEVALGIAKDLEVSKMALGIAKDREQVDELLGTATDVNTAEYDVTEMQRTVGSAEQGYIDQQPCRALVTGDKKMQCQDVQVHWPQGLIQLFIDCQNGKPAAKFRNIAPHAMVVQILQYVWHMVTVWIWNSVVTCFQLTLHFCLQNMFEHWSKLFAVIVANLYLLLLFSCCS